MEGNREKELGHCCGESRRFWEGQGGGGFQGEQ